MVNMKRASRVRGPRLRENRGRGMLSEAAILSRPRRAQVMIGLMIGPAMQAADATIVNVALPRLQESLGGGIALGSWVVTAYLCAAAVVAPLTGAFYRRWGARAMLMGAIVAFVLASLLCMAAPTMPLLVLFRLFQGAAGGILQPAAQAALLDFYPKRDHGRLQAIWGAAIMAGPVLGPVLGGLITDLASWRCIFAINLPLGLLAIAGLRAAPAHAGPREAGAVDLRGLVLVAIAVAAVQLCLQRGIGRDWLHSPELLAEAGIAAAAAAAIAYVVTRGQFRLFSVAVFKNVNFATANVLNFLVFAMLYVTVVFLPALSEGPLGYDATVTGLVVAPRGLAMVVMMVGVGTVMAKIDHRILFASGLVVMGAGMAMLARPAGAGALWLGVGSAIQGVGAGILLAPMSTLAFYTLAASLRADAAGVYLLLRQLGGAAGVAVMTAILQLRIDARIAGLASYAEPDSGQLLGAAKDAAYGDCFRAMALLTVILLPTVLLFRVPRLVPEPALEPGLSRPPEAGSPTAAIPGPD
jgi:MFS transporter, DHA2 family, multidrug resistance protein